MRDVLPMVSDVTQTIAKNIKIALSPEETQFITWKKSVNPEIYKLYLKGKFQLNKDTKEGFQKGIQMLNDVIGKEPTYALPYATLAIGYGDLAHLPSAPQDAFPRAKALATKALELDNTLVEAHTAMAECEMYYDWKFKTAENSFKEALAIDSNFAPALEHYGWLLAIFGRNTEAEKYLRKAADLDPLFPVFRTWLAWYLWMEGRNDDAIAESKRVLEISPDFPLADFVLGGAYADIGKYDEAIALNKKASKMVPALTWALGAAYFKAGKKQEAMNILDSIEETPKNAYSLVRIYQVLGDFDNAVKWVQVAYDTHHMFTPWLVRVNSPEPLMKDPRFVRILKPIIDSLPPS